MAQYVAWKAPKESQLTAEEKKHRADMKAQKAALIDALNAKCRCDTLKSACFFIMITIPFQ